MIVERGNEVDICDGWGMIEITKLQIRHVVPALSTWAHPGTQNKVTQEGAM